jgi:hypothetical protein
MESSVLRCRLDPQSLIAEDHPLPVKAERDSSTRVPVGRLVTQFPPLADHRLDAVGDGGVHLDAALGGLLLENVADVLPSPTPAMTIEAAVPRADGWMVFGASASARKAAMPGMRRQSLRRDSFCID